MLYANYSHKKDLKTSLGKRLDYRETSVFGHEYLKDGINYVVGPDTLRGRQWYAAVTMRNGLIESVK